MDINDKQKSDVEEKSVEAKSDVEEKSDVYERAFEFADRVLKMDRALSRNRNVNRNIMNQLISSATSVGSERRSQQIRLSRKDADFIKRSSRIALLAPFTFVCRNRQSIATGATH